MNWTPDATQAPSTHAVTVRAEDGVAGATTSFNVIVREPPREVVAAEAVLTAVGELRFAWKTVAGFRYVVQSRPELLADDWQEVTGDTAVFTRPAGDDRSGFFRVLLVE